MSIGIERLFSILEQADQDPRTTETEAYIVSAHKGLLEQRMKLVAELWEAGVKVSLASYCSALLKNLLIKSTIVKLYVH